MRSLAIFAAVIGCGPTVAPPPRVTWIALPSLPPPPFDPVPQRAPDLPRDPAPSPGPVAIPLEPFVPTTLQVSAEPPFAAGTIRTIRKLRTAGTIGDMVFEVPRRVAIGRAYRWWLVEPIEDRVIAEIGSPRARLSDTELVVRHGKRDAIVDLRDGKTITPIPRLPIEAPIEATYIVHANEQDGSSWYAIERAEAGADVFLIAVAGGRRFVGPWNDRALAPELIHEIENTKSGWRTNRREDGVHLSFGIPESCKGLRLYRTRAPECVEPTFQTVNTGSWEITLALRTGDTARLVAHDLATGRDEVVELPCKKPRIIGRSLDVPRVLVDCDDYPYKTTNSIVAWTPGRARMLRPNAGEDVPGHVLFDRLAPLVTEAEDSHGNPIGQRWLDLDTGRVFRGPEAANLIDAGSPSITLVGTGVARRAMVIDADRGTVRDAGPVPCRGAILLDNLTGDYTAISCGIADRPGKFDFARVWSKIIDTRNAKIYDLPGYPAGLFADGIVILSNRTRLTAETRGPQATLTVARLE